MFVFVIRIVVPLTAPPLHYNTDLLGDKHINNCYLKWYEVMWILSGLEN